MLREEHKLRVLKLGAEDEIGTKEGVENRRVEKNAQRGAL